MFEELRGWRRGGVRPSNLPEVVAVSAKTGAGLRELRLIVADAAGLPLS